MEVLYTPPLPVMAELFIDFFKTPTLDCIDGKKHDETDKYACAEDNA